MFPRPAEELAQDFVRIAQAASAISAVQILDVAADPRLDRPVSPPTLHVLRRIVPPSIGQMWSAILMLGALHKWVLSLNQACAHYLGRRLAPLLLVVKVSSRGRAARVRHLRPTGGPRWVCFLLFCCKLMLTFFTSLFHGQCMLINYPHCILCWQPLLELPH